MAVSPFVSSETHLLLQPKDYKFSLANTVIHGFLFLHASYTMYEVLYDAQFIVILSISLH